MTIPLGALYAKIINAVSLMRRILSRRMIFIDVPNPEDKVAGDVIRQLATDIHRLFGIKEFIGVAWRGGHSDHEKGLALDIIPNCFPFIPRFGQQKTMEAVHAYLLAHTENYKISYVIWQNTIAEHPQWKPKKNITHSAGRTPSDLHLDHIHVSFMKAGE